MSRTDPLNKPYFVLHLSEILCLLKIGLNLQTSSLSLHAEDMTSVSLGGGAQESPDNDSQHPSLDHPDNIDGKCTDS